MANDERGAEQVAATTAALPSEEEITQQATMILDSLRPIVDSPKTQLILRNAILMLLELPDHSFTVERALMLITNEEARGEIVLQLTRGTPALWSQEWNTLWSKDHEPNYSKAQQHTASRLELAKFWGKEWSEIPEEVRRHVADLLGSLR